MPDDGYDIDAVWSAFPDSRMAPYLRLAHDRREALELYEWGARMSAAAFVVVGHLEVLVRHAVDSRLREHFEERRRGIPWFLLQRFSDGRTSTPVGVVRRRLQHDEARRELRGVVRDTRDQVVAGLDFTFWCELLGPRHEDLWRVCLSQSFPGSPRGLRKGVWVRLERARRFRNKLAHHDSMINVDVPFEIRQLVELAGCIDKDAARWLEQHAAHAMSVYAERPRVPEDTVVVAAAQAWPLYEQCHAYVCQPGRTFRAVERLAFYTGGEIREHVPRIVHRRDNVVWSREEAGRLRDSDDRPDRKVAAVINASREQGWTGGMYQVFLLTRPGDADHRELRSPLPHERTGRGSAFTQRQRYVSLHALESAKSTADLWAPA